MENKKMTEQEMQTEFINTNMDVLQKYLIWREVILQPQILDAGVEMPAIDTDVVDLSFMDERKGDLTQQWEESFNGTSGHSITEQIIKNYGIID